jgi:hypothetical protein
MHPAWSFDARYNAQQLDRATGCNQRQLATRQCSLMRNTMQWDAPPGSYSRRASGANRPTDRNTLHSSALTPSTLSNGLRILGLPLEIMPNFIAAGM